MGDFGEERTVHEGCGQGGVKKNTNLQDMYDWKKGWGGKGGDRMGWEKTERNGMVDRKE